jgi:cytoskeletal protein RodZ
VNLTVSPQIRIVAIVGLVAALGLGASMFMLGGHGTKTNTQSATTTAVRRHAPPARPTKPATPHATKPHASTKPRTTTKHAAKATHRHATKPAKFRGNPVYAQLPQALQWELAHHKVVVVSLYNPASDTDAISVAEAHAGAVEAGAGFLLVNVLDNKVAGILTGLRPDGSLLPDPGVLVYRAPGDVAIELDGFNDRDAVAQAAKNAMAGESESTSTTAVTSTTPAAAAVPATTTPGP